MKNSDRPPLFFVTKTFETAPVVLVDEGLKVFLVFEG
jgi:hypothetical protein